MSILEVTELAHGYGANSVLHDISFRMVKNEHIGIVGANGAGKSTLFKIITGQLLPDSGSITWHPKAKMGSLEQHIYLTAGDSLKIFLQGAFQELFLAEQKIKSLTEQMTVQTGKQLESTLKTYSKLQTRLEQENFYGIDAQIEEVAAGLGLTSLGLGTDVAKLSGGQRTKLLLAKLLLEKPDVLLLDEPTNYLDAAHINWLTDYLKDYPHAFMLITHDSEFMNSVVNVIYHLEHKSITRYQGNYKQFLAAYELRKKQVQQQYERQQKEIEKFETYIQKNKARAATAKQAKSREKQLQKMTRIEKPGSIPQPKFTFYTCNQPARLILETKNLVIGYDKPLFSALDLKLMRGEKIAITGHNGVGKTTTLKTLLKKVEPLTGDVSLGERVIPAFFEQEIQTSGQHSAIEEIWSTFPNLTEKEVRQKLACCGLTKEQITQPLISLSGGEQTKVRLCKLQLTQSNFLILDEPTNHLDILAKAALKKALQNYDGTIILVSHEPEFYQDWVTKVWNMEKWVL